MINPDAVEWVARLVVGTVIGLGVGRLVISTLAPRRVTRPIRRDHDRGS